ncbi:hypothetical protein D9758_018025 [Tetrapyrgos nigripes]|uniref:MYND-type domain-containing protein n=1 Tax=Tetrapyrgos nigripes TaxID=182062 RepID=A0A8H5BRI4_9AGAR|nr:hypothetical protein D9758_018025 [Tetrapyrgos nigripes]
MPDSTLAETLRCSLDNMNTKQEKVSALLSAMDQGREHRPLNGSGLNNTSLDDLSSRVDWMDLARQHGIEEDLVASILNLDSRDTSTHLNFLECGNHDLMASPSRRCRNKATKTCSQCLLVSYCSAACQKEHWRNHKQDCKHPLRLNDWQPRWVQEQRSPAFMQPGTGSNKQTFHGKDLSLWGNMPAIDILNLNENEGLAASQTRDLALAFVASGDLRNVIRTVNELPENYAGTLKILINDRDQMVQCRNLLLLVALGMIPELNEATEIAIHLWYSLFLPNHWLPEIMKILQSSGLITTDEGLCTLSPGPHSTLNILMDAETKFFFGSTFLLNEPDKLTLGIANNVWSTHMRDPNRVDYIERFYLNLEPSHRLAIDEWRRFGVLYPFDACSNYLNQPNPWLFSHDHELFLSDYSSPKEGWDMNAAFEAGKAHGTTRANLMGCLYFYLKDQLKSFAHRLRTFHIDISLVRYDAVELAKAIKNEAVPGIPRMISFDRIEVSNAVDAMYAGVKPMLEAWGPFLKPKAENEHAAIIGLFMNWPLYVEGARVKDSNAKMEEMTHKFTEQYPEIIPKDIGKDRKAMQKLNAIMMSVLHNTEICHDNSEAFNKYLRGNEAFKACKNAGLKTRTRNTIVPHRIAGTLGSEWNVLPPKLTGEKKYVLMDLQSFTWQERYVEWVKA